VVTVVREVVAFGIVVISILVELVEVVSIGVVVVFIVEVSV
jgi:hypothetical protein